MRTVWTSPAPRPSSSRSPSWRPRRSCSRARRSTSAGTSTSPHPGRARTPSTRSASRASSSTPGASSGPRGQRWTPSHCSSTRSRSGLACWGAPRCCGTTTWSPPRRIPWCRSRVTWCSTFAREHLRTAPLHGPGRPGPAHRHPARSRGDAGSRARSVAVRQVRCPFCAGGARDSRAARHLDGPLRADHARGLIPAGAGCPRHRAQVHEDRFPLWS